MFDLSSIEGIGSATIGFDGIFTQPVDVAGFLTSIELFQNVAVGTENSAADAEYLVSFLATANPGFHTLFIAQEAALQQQVDTIIAGSVPGFWDYFQAEATVLETAYTGIATSLYAAAVTPATQASNSVHQAVSTIGGGITPTA